MSLRNIKVVMLKNITCRENYVDNKSEFSHREIIKFTILHADNDAITGFLSV